MKYTSKIAALLTVALLETTTGALAGQPPDVVPSDGAGNTAMGDKALLDSIPYPDANPGSTNNTAAGFSALNQNTVGQQNTAVGAAALLANTTGTDNVAVGMDALADNVGASFNTAVGSQALIFNRTGQFNTASGYETLQYNNACLLYTSRCV